jgi:hypothetical protein
MVQATPDVSSLSVPPQSQASATPTPTLNPLLRPATYPGFMVQATPDVSSLSVPPPSQASVILSPTANQLVHDVGINVVRGQQNKDDGVFDLQWSYLQGGTWHIPDSSPLDTLDKTASPNGVTLPNSIFTQFPCGSSASPCQFRTWRVRARIDGGPSGYGCDWVQFRVQ